MHSGNNDAKNFRQLNNFLAVFLNFMSLHIANTIVLTTTLRAIIITFNTLVHHLVFGCMFQCVFLCLSIECIQISSIKFRLRHIIKFKHKTPIQYRQQVHHLHLGELGEVEWLTRACWYLQKETMNPVFVTSPIWRSISPVVASSEYQDKFFHHYQYWDDRLEW